MTVRSASFAIRVVRRNTGLAAIIYRRSLNTAGAERLTRVAAINSLAYSAGASLLRSSVELSGKNRTTRLEPGPFYPLDPDGGARVACYAVVSSGLRNGTRLSHAAENLKRADGTEVAWWFGLMKGTKGRRAVRALRILVEAVK